MTQLSPETVWNMNEEQLSSLLNSGNPTPNQRRIRFYAPSFMYYRTSHFCSTPMDFPTISITGEKCALNCGHCGGIVLNTMYPATTPEKLLELCRRLKREGATGCLISGGCLTNGSVPLDKFVDTIGRVKHELGLTVFVHTGVVDSGMAKALKNAGVDAALIDIVGSDETIRGVYNLNVTVADYSESLNALEKVGIAFVPHVVVGLDYGRLKGELQALKMIAKHRPSALVIIVFMPIHGTKMQNTEPPKPLYIAKVIATARLTFPKTPLILGCMRPKGAHRGETDLLAMKAGVDGIAFPAEEAIDFAEAKGYAIDFSSLCCAQAHIELKYSVGLNE